MVLLYNSILILIKFDFINSVLFFVIEYTFKKKKKKEYTFKKKKFKRTHAHTKKEKEKNAMI